MHKRPFTQLALYSAIALTLTGCGGGKHHDRTDNPPPTPGDVFAVTTSNKLLSFNRDSAGTLRTSASITGLSAGEQLLGIDFRPADGVLYGVSSTGRLYSIDTASAVATLKSTLAADPADTSAPFTALAGAQFGVAFNPVADRLRVVSDSGQNLRINVDTGAVTTDGPINGGAANTAISASAYTNAFAASATTTLFAIDAVTDTLYTQAPPNNGTLSLPVSLGVDAGSVNGFDIDAVTNTGYAALTVGGVRSLYSINLSASSNAASVIAALDGTQELRGIALRPAKAPVIVGLSDAGTLVSFAPLTPNSLTSTVTISGVAAGETLLGMDVRPKDRLLYALSSAGKIYTIDPATGAATAKATLTADAADATSPYVGIGGSAFAVDFNPLADRLRVISDTGQNLRIHVDTGATTTDAAINAAGATPLVTGAAYTNSFAGTTTTSLLDIDTNGATLALQNPPNDGTLVAVGALGVNAAGNAGLDIAGGANGLALAALRTSAGGPSSLYRIDLLTGAATLVNGAANPAMSLVGSGTGLRDIAIMLK